VEGAAAVRPGEASVKENDMVKQVPDAEMQGSMTLVCLYEQLTALLGSPRRVYSGDGKVRIRWEQFVEGVGRVEIYDYRQDRVPVEQVRAWSIEADPAVREKLVEMLSRVDIEDELQDFEMMDLLRVKEWLAPHAVPHGVDLGEGWCGEHDLVGLSGPFVIRVREEMGEVAYSVKRAADGLEVWQGRVI
jgi:hypothetical protein